MPPPAPSTTAVTRAIYLGTFAALLVVAALSVVIYRSTVSSAIAQHSTQQLVMVRTAAVGVQGEIRGLAALLRQFNVMPSVQDLIVPFLGQRIEATFGDNANGIVRYVVRIDADGRLFYWTPGGELLTNGALITLDPTQWPWTTNPANRGKVGISSAWWLPGSPASLRVLMTPVWRTSPSGENPTPVNDFNGMVGLAIDLSQLVEIYLGPAITELADDQSVVGLATPDFNMQMGPGGRSTSSAFGDQHQHDEPEGISILDDQAGRRIHTWARLDAVGQSWEVRHRPSTVGWLPRFSATRSSNWP